MASGCHCPSGLSAQTDRPSCLASAMAPLSQHAPLDQACTLPQPLEAVHTAGAQAPGFRSGQGRETSQPACSRQNSPEAAGAGPTQTPTSPATQSPDVDVANTLMRGSASAHPGSQPPPSSLVGSLRPREAHTGSLSRTEGQAGSQAPEPEPASCTVGSKARLVG